VIDTVLNSDQAGALPTLYAATAADVVDGGYYVHADCSKHVVKSWDRRASPVRQEAKPMQDDSGSPVSR
jgi:hypothetical protein